MNYNHTGADVQDVKQAIAHTIYCLETQGWMPDYYDYQSTQTSRVNLALRSFIPDEGEKGAVTTLRWHVRDGQFNVGGRNISYQRFHFGIRAGVEMKGA